MKIWIIIFNVFWIHSYFAQSIVRVEIEKINVGLNNELAYPKFIDDNEIIVTTSGYHGLYNFNLQSGEIITVSTENGAGYMPLTSDEGLIIYRTFNINKGKRYFNLKEFDKRSGESKTLTANKRSLKLPRQYLKNSLVYIEDNQLYRESLQKNSKNSLLSENSVFSEDNNLILISNGIQKTINPLGKGVYVWESLSPDGKYILFTFSNKGSFLCNLSGEILFNIPDAHYPRFSPDGIYISYMKDEDNGERYTASDIYIYSLETEETIKLTDTENKIEMFAEWSPDSNRLIYHTTEGEIYLAKIIFEN